MSLSSNCQNKINDLKSISVCNKYVWIIKTNWVSLFMLMILVHFLIRNTSPCTSCGNSCAVYTKRKTWRLIDPLFFILPCYRSSFLDTSIHLVMLLPKLTKLQIFQTCASVWLFFCSEKMTLTDNMTSPAYGYIPWW